MLMRVTEANDELGQGLTAPPDEPEAEEPTDADAEVARASERSGKQYLLDALGEFFHRLRGSQRLHLLWEHQAYP